MNRLQNEYNFQHKTGINHNDLYVADSQLQATA